MFLNPRDILSHLPLAASFRVGDFGTGAGHYGYEVAEKLGAEGVVYAFDAYTPSLDAVYRRGKTFAPQFHALHSDLNEHIPVRENLLDAAVVANTLSGLSERSRFVSELARVIRPSGSVLVVDWLSSFKNMGPPADATITPADAVRLFRSSGFSVGEMLPAGTHHFAFIATVQ